MHRKSDKATAPHRWLHHLGWAVLSVAALLLGALPVYAQNAVSGITSPATGASISGDVPIFGTAVIEPFQKYELHYKMEPSGDDAYIYFYGNTVPVINGQLGVWQAGGLPPGIYSLRLRVVKNDGNYAEYFAQNLSVNQSPPTPTPTPTPSEPTPTPIPTATFTPAPQPTPVVGQVAQPTVEGSAPVDAAAPSEAVAAAVPPPAAEVAPAAAVTNAVTLAEVTNPATGEIGGSVTRELGEALSLTRLRTHFFNGVRFSAALFLGVVALYAGKRLFDWVWGQFS
ncbi:MAG TPA: hypothetical protein VNK95_07340 [Caldilineaceae bacterium]|nr:hypothetical protein [Caldilineaceae bacterium]